MRSKSHLVFRSNVRQCAACGCNVAWTKTKAGVPYLVDIEFDQRQNDWFFKSFGNHYNLRVAHDCLAEQRRFLETHEFDLQRLGERFGVSMEFDGRNEAGERDGAAIKAAWLEKRETLARFIKDADRLNAQHDLFLDKLFDAQERNNLRREYAKQIADRKARIAEMEAKLAATRK